MTVEKTSPARWRLEPHEERPLHPLSRSSRTTACALYWMPVYSDPIEWREKQWLMSFFDELHKVLVERHKLRQESFLQMKVAAALGPVKDLLHENQMKLIPIMGLGLKPGAKLPPIPTEEDLKPVMEGKQKFIFNDYVGDYSVWLMARDERWKRSLFLGSGGYTMLYLLPDPKTVPPPIPDHPGIRSMPFFAENDVDGMWEMTHLLADDFCPRSKKVFSKNDQDTNFDGTTFIIPLLSAQDFLQAPPDEVEAWFTVFDVFVQESPKDNGLLIASKFDLDEELIQILKSLRDREIDHPHLKERSDDVAN
jgi:hypothetical protein